MGKQKAKVTEVMDGKTEFLIQTDDSREMGGARVDNLWHDSWVCWTSGNDVLWNTNRTDRSGGKGRKKRRGSVINAGMESEGKPAAAVNRKWRREVSFSSSTPLCPANNNVPSSGITQTFMIWKGVEHKERGALVPLEFHLYAVMVHWEEGQSNGHRPSTSWLLSGGF